MAEQEKTMRLRSGQVSSDDSLVLFLYVIMRDILTPGRVEEIMQQHVESPSREEIVEFSNGWLAKHAMDLAERLRKK